MAVENLQARRTKAPKRKVKMNFRQANHLSRLFVLLDDDKHSVRKRSCSPVSGLAFSLLFLYASLLLSRSGRAIVPVVR